MTVLLDENFPLALYRQLRADGVDVEHIITIGWRGASDVRIRERFVTPDLVFLTQDEDFLFDATGAATVVVSRVRQSRPLAERVQLWRDGLERLLRSQPRAERQFELLDDGGLLPWAQAGAGQDTWVAKPVER